MVPAVTVPIPTRVCVQSASTLVGVGAELQRSAHVPAIDFAVTARPPSHEGRSQRDKVAVALTASGLRSLEWAHAIGRDVLFAADGAVFRVPGGVDLDPRDYVARARKLIDLSDMRFELIRAPPEAMRWQL